LPVGQLLSTDGRENDVANGSTALSTTRLWPDDRRLRAATTIPQHESQIKPRSDRVNLFTYSNS